MSTIVPRYTSDPLAYDFEVLIGDEPADLTGATFASAVFAPDGTSINASSVLALLAPDAHVVQVVFSQGVLAQTGQYEIQIKVTIPGRPEPIRSRVFVVLENSAI